MKTARLVPAFLLWLIVSAAAVVPEHRVVDGKVVIEGVGPDSPIIYDNDWWFDVFDNNYLWAQASLGHADLRGNIVSRDMWEWQKGYKYAFADSWKDAEKAVALARTSGIGKIPDPVRGSEKALERPESGRIGDTVSTPTEGSRLIVAEAMLASAEKPLVIVAGGPQTTVANALLARPEIASRIVVFNLTVSGGYNGKDGWAAYIVAKLARSVDWGGGDFWEKDSVFTREHFDALPDNPFADDMKRFIRTDLGRANQLGDGAPLVWLFQPKCWTGADTREAEFRGGNLTYAAASAGKSGDVLVIPRSETDLDACREEFLRVMLDPRLFK